MLVFRAMNTDVAIAAPGLEAEAEGALAGRIARLFARTERRFSRFRAHSELSVLNRAAGAIRVSAELAELLRAAGDHVETTDGVFDPAVGAALCAAGYDRSFAPGALDRTTPPATAPPRARFADLDFDVRTRVVRRPPHLAIDLGGFLKGRTVDQAAALAPTCALIDAGGDMVLRGAGPDGGGWLVEIEDPADPRRTVATLRLRDRAVATSAPNRRRWRAGAEVAHHLIDPRTGAPSRSELAQVTVVAATAEQADVLAKVCFLLGEAEAARFLARRAPADVGAVLVRGDGGRRVLGALEVTDA